MKAHAVPSLSASALPFRCFLETSNNQLKRKNSVKNRGEITGRMQHADHLNALLSRSIEDEIVRKFSDRHYAHTLQILTLKCPGTAHTRQRNQLRTRGFQGWHKTRRCLGILGPDIGNDL